MGLYEELEKLYIKDSMHMSDEQSDTVNTFLVRNKRSIDNLENNLSAPLKKELEKLQTASANQLIFCPQGITEQQAIARFGDKAKFLDCRQGFDKAVKLVLASEQTLFITSDPCFLTADLFFDHESGKSSVTFYLGDTFLEPGISKRN